jgi:hypothetical protein
MKTEKRPRSALTRPRSRFVCTDLVPDAACGGVNEDRGEAWVRFNAFSLLMHHAEHKKERIIPKSFLSLKHHSAKIFDPERKCRHELFNYFSFFISKPNSSFKIMIHLDNLFISENDIMNRGYLLDKLARRSSVLNEIETACFMICRKN